MMTRLLLSAGAVTGLFLLPAGCGRQGPTQPQRPSTPSAHVQKETGEWAITSTAFREGERIPRKHTCDGEDVSPLLSWTAPPEKTAEFALICDDPDAPGGTFTHWVLYGLPSTIASLPENVAKTETLPTLGGARQGKNSAGSVGYMGPCPPSGPAHHYHFILYALDADLDLRPGMTAGELRQAMEGHVLSQTELVGLYSR